MNPIYAWGGLGWIPAATRHCMALASIYQISGQQIFGAITVDKRDVYLVYAESALNWPLVNGYHSSRLSRCLVRLQIQTMYNYILGYWVYKEH